MHQSSYNTMGYLINKYLSIDREVSILDVGSYDENGNYRNLFHGPYWHYEGCDILSGPNVDFLMIDNYNIGKDDESYDVIISGQTMEHVEFIWNWIQELQRVLRKGGIMILIAPGCGPIHRHPFDCWRFHPDGMRALAKWANMEVLESFISEELPWKDCVLVALK